MRWLLLLLGIGTANAQMVVTIPPQGAMTVSSPNGTALRVGDNAGGSPISDYLQILGNNSNTGRVSISTGNNASDINITPGNGKQVKISMGGGTLATGVLNLGTNATYSGWSLPSLNENVTVSGSIAPGGAAWQNLISLSDGTDASATPLFSALYVSDFMAPSSKGTKVGVNSRVNIPAPTSSTPQMNAQYIGGEFTANATSDDNGTVASPAGILFGLNTVSSMSSSATNWLGNVSIEADIGSSGTGLVDKIGEQIVLLATDTVAGSRDDVGLSFNAQGHVGSSTPGWGTMIGIGRHGGAYPLNAASVIMQAMPCICGGDNLVAGYGIKLDNIKFTSAAYTSPGFSVGPTGAVAATSYSSGSTVGVSCQGPPTASFAVTSGIVTHC